ncbi:MAG: NAD(P)/FAD-dependent oxidoreductase [Alphaproteobacteria bacterium]|nr:NAD(P)/FAD-dependent oxidoreductase [Alphaproteobacteria bacterium]
MSGERKHVIVLGAGFGGLAAAKALARAPVEVTVIDRRNYHLFQPLLYQVATAGLSPADIAWPIRSLFNRQKNAAVIMAEVTSVDLPAGLVATTAGDFTFDDLVVATGARHAYFGHPEWQDFAPGLKSISDATMLRRRILLALEKAETTDDEEERRRLLTFVLVGGGPTGVELAGALAELTRRALARDFRRINPRNARIVLVESGDRLLTGFSPSLSAYTAKKLGQMGVELRFGRPIVDCDALGVRIADEKIDSATVIWTAGVAATKVAEWLAVGSDAGGADAGGADDRGRVRVAPDLSIPGHPNIFVIGDAATIKDSAGRPVPGTAAAAKQQGRFVGQLIAAGAQGTGERIFRYRDIGNWATIGRNAAVIELGPVRLKGVVAWWVWGTAHICFLIGVRAPLLVALQWLWSYATFGKGARLITGATVEEMERRRIP